MSLVSWVSVRSHSQILDTNHSGTVVSHQVTCLKSAFNIYSSVFTDASSLSIVWNSANSGNRNYWQFMTQSVWCVWQVNKTTSLSQRTEQHWTILTNMQQMPECEQTLTETGSLLSLKAWKLKLRGCWVAFLMGTKFPEHSRCNGIPSISCRQFINRRLITAVTDSDKDLTLTKTALVGL